MIDPVVIRAYVENLPKKELDRVYTFLRGVSSDVLEVPISLRDVLREHNDPARGTTFGSLAFWKGILFHELEIPLHCIEVVPESPKYMKIPEYLRDREVVVTGGGTGGERDQQQQASGGEGVQRVGAGPQVGNLVEAAESGASTTAQNAGGSNESEDSDEDEGDGWELQGRTAGDEIFLDFFGLNDKDNYSAPATSSTSPRGAARDEQQPRFRVVINEYKILVEKERSDLHRMKWHKLNNMGPDRVGEFFYLELYKQHQDFTSKVRQGYRLLLPPERMLKGANKDELIGLRNIERAFYDFPSKIDPKLYDILLKDYPFEKGCYNKAEFYRLCHESPFLAHAMVRHPQVAIPDQVLNVVDPTCCTMFNNKPLGSEELGLAILEKYGSRLSKKMLNAIAEPHHTSCLTRAIVAGYETLALAFLDLVDERQYVTPPARGTAGDEWTMSDDSEIENPEFGMPILTKELLEEPCRQGYAIYHRQYGRQFSYLADFPNNNGGRHPQPTDIAHILGMPKVHDRIQELIKELS
ncbi:unnamed protein product [Amoebophrya sp. A25]|nr:unnamed protein product [Amoebophrya sp. A25]|eukprot:GSA25T00012962001.1